MLLNPSKLSKFIDPLPILKIQSPLRDNYYEMKYSQFKQKLHSQLPKSTLWGINNSYPGPTIEVYKDEEIHVKWINDLPNKHLFPIDRTIYDACTTPEVRTVPHLHGAKVPSIYDGYPLSWFTNNFQQLGPTFSEEIYVYNNKQQATTLWYHDHSMGVSRINNYAGLNGLYIIRDSHEESLNLPSGSYEVPLVIQDRCFNEDGSLHYPKNESDPCATKSMDTDTGVNNKDIVPNDNCEPSYEYMQKNCISIVPEFVGDFILVNGKVWPYLEVEKRKYRFRILNGSNSRFYNLRLSNKRGFYQIGTDLGFLNKPVKLKKLLLGPSERADIIIDFSKFDDDEIVFLNDANIPYPNGEKVNEHTSKVMQFKLIDSKGIDKSCIPSILNNIQNPATIKVDNTRKIFLVHNKDRFNRERMLLNNKTWFDKVDLTPKFGTTEVWEFYNTTMKSHPMHIHLVSSQILNIQNFKVENGNYIYTSNPYLPPFNEQGLKDTIKVDPGTVVRVVMKFDYYFGKYVVHCHMLEHEDHDMMRPFEIVK